MPFLNQASIIGNLGADPDCRKTKVGGSVCDIRVATTRRWRGEAGETKDRTEWHRVVAWGKLADWLGGPHGLAKGDLVYVQGELRTREYETQDKGRQRVTEIHAETVQRLVRAGGHGPSSQSPRGEAPAGGGGPAPEGAAGDDGEIPF